MLLLGLLAFFQITFIPGAMILKSAKIQGTILQNIIYAFALSLIANYCFIFLLSTMQLYTQLSMLIILGAEITSLVWLYKNDLQLPVFDVLENQIRNFKETVDAIIHLYEDKNPDNAPSKLLNTLLTFALLMGVIAGITWGITIFINNIGSVFNTWDAVVSWNRWALSWASGQIPLDSRSYPQLIPANWSTTYILMGSTTIQTIAKGIMPLFAVFLLIGLLDLGLKTKLLGFFISGIFTHALIKKFLQPEITSGYVDVAVAFFSFLAIYSLVKANSAENPSHAKQHIILGAIFSAGAGVTKQPGMYIFLLYPILAYISLAHKNTSLLKQNFKKHFNAFVFVAFIPLSWYLWYVWHLFQQVSTVQLEDVITVQEYLDVTTNTYADVSFGTQIIMAISQFEGYLILFGLIIVGFPLLNSFYRALAILIVFPYPLIWAWLAGYDMRNLAIFMPIFALTAGISLQELYYFSLKKLKWTSSFRVKNYMPIGGILIAIIVGLLAIPPTKLINQQTQLQKQLFSPSKNEKIYAVIQQDGPDTKILTNYPIRYLPGLENNQVQFGFQNFDTFITWVGDPDIQYLFINNRASDTIKSYIDEKISEGDYELVFIDKEWVTYKMIRIVNR